MNEKELKELLTRSVSDFDNGVNLLVRGIVEKAVETAVAHYDSEIAKLRVDIENYQIQCNQLTKDLNEAEDGRKFFKEQWEKEQEIPKLRDVIESILVIVTSLYNILSTLPKERADFIKRTIQNALSPYGRLIVGKSEAYYNAKQDECIASEPAPTHMLQEKIKEVQCCGFEFDKKYGLELIKEKVVVYTKVQKERSPYAEPFDSRAYRLRHSLHYVLINNDNQRRTQIGCADSIVTLPRDIDLEPKYGDIIEIQICDEHAKSIKHRLIIYEVPHKMFNGKYILSFALVKQGQYLYPKITLFDKASSKKEDEFIGNYVLLSDIFMM